MILPFRKHVRGEKFPWVILINGLFTDHDVWDTALNSITEYNILTYNGRGQGDGPALTSSYDLDQQVQDLKNLIEHVELKKVALIGLSNGGRLALKFASLHPDKVWSLVACDTYANLTPLLKLKIESWLKAHHEGGATHRFDVATPWVWGERLIEENPELLNYYREKSKTANDKNIVSLMEGALSGEVDLKAIVTPTLLIAGEEDLLTPVFHHKKLKDQIDSSQLEVVEGGHACLIEHPEIFSEKILPFLRSQCEVD